VNPDAINVIGAVIIAALGTWQAIATVRVKATEGRTEDLENRVEDLEARVKAVEAERDKFRSLFRSAVRYIRTWMNWGMLNAPGVPQPPLPPELVDEV